METKIIINSSDGLNTLRLSTSKSAYSGLIETTASVCKTSYDRGFHTLEFRMFTDFLKTVIATEGRATKKRIQEQHEKALKNIEHIKALAIAHYTKIGENITFDETKR
jgi:hypothetical protein